VSGPFELGFKAFDPHELLPHAVARRCGFYAEEGVEVRLVDIALRPDVPPPPAQVSCGAAALAAAAGAPVRIVLVACAAPLFWLYGRGLEPLADGARIAAYPEVAPPAHFLRTLLERRGISAVLLPCRDDGARLGLLVAGEVDAAVLSSATPGPRAQAAGAVELVAFADELSAPTTGLAVSEGFLEREPRSVAAVATALRRALAVIHDDAVLAEDVVAASFGQTAAEARWMVERFRSASTAGGLSLTELAPTMPR